MSTIKVNKIENTSTTDGGVSIDNDGHVTIDGQQLPTAGPLSNRNLIINGAMQVAQRGTSSSTGTTGQFPCVDRLKTNLDLPSGVTDLTFSQQDTGGLVGFPNCFRTTPNQARTAALALSDRCWVQYLIEAQDLQSLGVGTAQAKSLTLSFWMRTNLTSGSVGLEIQASDSSGTAWHSLHQSATVPASADTWQYYTIPIAANTGGTINDDNGVGLVINFQYASGPNFQGGSRTEGVWHSEVNDVRAPADSIDIYSSTSNYVDITGVQLEVGSKATPFEHRSYGDELARCQRYYQKLTYEGNDVRVGIGQAINSSSVDVYIPFVTTMRASPTALEQSGTAADYGIINASGGGGDCTSIPSFRFANLSSITVRFTDTGQVSAGNASQAYLDTANAFLAWSAEL